MITSFSAAAVISLENLRESIATNHAAASGRLRYDHLARRSRYRRARSSNESLTFSSSSSLSVVFRGSGERSDASASLRNDRGADGFDRGVYVHRLIRTPATPPIIRTTGSSASMVMLS